MSFLSDVSLDSTARSGDAPSGVSQLRYLRLEGTKMARRMSTLQGGQAVELGSAPCNALATKRATQQTPVSGSHMNLIERCSLSAYASEEGAPHELYMWFIRGEHAHAFDRAQAAWLVHKM